MFHVCVTVGNIGEEFEPWCLAAVAAVAVALAAARDGDCDDDNDGWYTAAVVAIE